MKNILAWVSSQLHLQALASFIYLSLYYIVEKLSSILVQKMPLFLESIWTFW